MCSLKSYIDFQQYVFFFFNQHFNAKNEERNGVLKIYKEFSKNEKSFSIVVVQWRYKHT